MGATRGDAARSIGASVWSRHRDVKAMRDVFRYVQSLDAAVDIPDAVRDSGSHYAPLHSGAVC